MLFSMMCKEKERVGKRKRKRDWEVKEIERKGNQREGERGGDMEIKVGRRKREKRKKERDDGKKKGVSVKV